MPEVRQHYRYYRASGRRVGDPDWSLSLKPAPDDRNPPGHRVDAILLDEWRSAGGMVSGVFRITPMTPKWNAPRMRRAAEAMMQTSMAAGAGAELLRSIGRRQGGA